MCKYDVLNIQPHISPYAVRAPTITVKCELNSATHSTQPDAVAFETNVALCMCSSFSLPVSSKAQ